MLAPLAALVVFLGVYPHPVGAVTSPTVPRYVAMAASLLTTWPRGGDRQPPGVAP